MMYNARYMVTRRIRPVGISGQKIDMVKTTRYFYYSDDSVINAGDENGALTSNTYDLSEKTWSQYIGNMLSKLEIKGTTSYVYDNNGNEISRLVSTISGGANPGYGLSHL